MVILISIFYITSSFKSTLFLLFTLLARKPKVATNRCVGYIYRRPE